MTDITNKNVRAMMLAMLGFTLYSFGDVFIKMAAAYYKPEQCGFFMNCFFLPLLILVSNKVGGLRATFASKKIPLHLLRACTGMVSFYMMTQGFHVLGMAKSYTLIFAAPFIATILSIFVFGEKIKIYRWLSIIGGFTGVLIVLHPGFIPLEPAAVGIVFAAIAYAIGTIIIRKIGPNEPLLAFSIFGSMGQLTVFGAYMLLTGEMVMPATSDLWLFPAAAVFNVFASFAISRAFSTGETSVVAPFHYTQLLWGVLFGYTIFHHSLDIWTAVGGAVIVSSGIYMIYRERVRHREMTHGVVAIGEALE